MRKEKTVLRQILQFVLDHDCLRAVTMNGSRVNPNAPRDIFQDYDVVVFGSDPRRFLNDQAWIEDFGELIILQQNDLCNHGVDCFIFLMLFSDGVRIDLTFAPLECLAFLAEDSLTQVLLDKDGRIPALPPPSDPGYWTHPPTRAEFDDTINEIFWCSASAAKGLWRRELPFAKAMTDGIVRPCLQRLLEWYAAMQRDWTINPGGYGKWLERYLPPDIWEEYVATFAGPGIDENWKALSAVCRLARRAGVEVAQRLGCGYPLQDDERVVAYLEQVRNLPPGAQDFG